MIYFALFAAWREIASRKAAKPAKKKSDSPNLETNSAIVKEFKITNL
jgi:hypothetical protein